jgi:short-subunit dehydrogenase
MTGSVGRTALVTGGSSGIGLAIASMLANEGYALTVCSRRRASVDEATASLRAQGATVNPVTADLADNEAADSVVAAHENCYGRLDVLVQSAGIGFYGSIAEHRAKALDIEIQLNYRTPVLLLQSALPMLTRAGAEHQKALVANIASFNGVNPAANLASYSATKAALIAFSRAAQAEVGHLGIQITALCPGYVDTPMSDFWSDQVPKGEMLRSADLAEAVRFLLRTSPACRVPEIVLARGNGEI